MKKIFEVLARVGNARAGKLLLAHGVVKTPVFMPVGTQASVKSLTPEDVENLGAEIILANTYHLYLRPGEKLIKKMGGLHEFMGWKKPMLTDSGGYQVSSLGWFRDDAKKVDKGLKRTVITDEGVTFWSHLDGSKHMITPEKSVEIQMSLGADIIMAFDEATPSKGKKYAMEAMRRTHSWLMRSIVRWKQIEKERGGESGKRQLLFGIIQGGSFKELRRESAEFVLSQDLPGVAVGGGSIGQDPGETEENVSWIRDLLPEDKPVYLMGVGVNPEDVLEAVKSGADMFDCVAPTRLARTGSLYSGALEGSKFEKLKFVSEYKNGRLSIANKVFADDKRVIDEACDCYTCRTGFSRAYLRHLFKCRELLYYRLASIHNLRFMVSLVEKIRARILEDGGL